MHYGIDERGDEGYKQCEMSFCGFNQDDKAYCASYMGDPQYTTVWKAMLEAIRTAQVGDVVGANKLCHVNSWSTIYDGIASANYGCFAYNKALNNEIQGIREKHLLTTFCYENFDLFL